MNAQRTIILSAICFLYGATMLLARAEFSTTNQGFPGIIYYSETRTNPPTRLWVAEIDLTQPHLHVRVAPGGPDPDGPGKWQATLMPPTQIAAREHFDLVVNGDFFDARNIKDAEGKSSGYRTGQWASVIGSAVTDGKIWSVSKEARPCLVVHTNQTVTIDTLATPPPDDWEVIGGNTLLIKDGVDVAPPVKTRHPRTAAGLDATGTKLILLVVDGRKPGIAVGMSYEELAREMLKLGCRQALNLDGGGSSLMAIRDPKTGEMKILSHPTDGHERAVADVLGISETN
ncbi:MAG: phosphodiester glycosidase family protein [Verrucomicrobiota bacterium]|jgi:exopolysaccharide biosynthesis protein